jgi:hypothetical protein
MGLPITIKSLASELSAQCTLQKTQHLNGCPFAHFWLIPLGDIQFSQHHTVSTKVDFGTGGLK